MPCYKEVKHGMSHKAVAGRVVWTVAGSTDRMALWIEVFFQSKGALMDDIFADKRIFS